MYVTGVVDAGEALLKTVEIDQLSQTYYPRQEVRGRTFAVMGLTAYEQERAVCVGGYVSGCWGVGAGGRARGF